MNRIAIGVAVQVNDNKMYACIPNLAFPTVTTFKAMARLKLARLKRKAQETLAQMAMAIIPMPQCAAA